MMMYAVLSNPNHLKYGVATIPFPIPRDQYTYCMDLLEALEIGDTVKVVKLHGEGPVKRRIMDMGITKGTEVFVRKVAPLGDPMEVTVRGYELSLRKADTEMIVVE